MMTRNEAIEFLRCNSYNMESCDKEECNQHEAITMAIEALEKQIPKKSKTSYDWYYLVEWKCVECGGTIDSPLGYLVEKYPYCPYCGQAVDWKEDLF